MLTVNETLDKLFRMPEEFEKHMEAGKYCKAKWCFTNAMITAAFIEAEEEVKDRLFKKFPEELVKEAFRKAGGPDDKGCGFKKEAHPAV